MGFERKLALRGAFGLGTCRLYVHA
jgi:hypothetical protein